MNIRPLYDRIVSKAHRRKRNLAERHHHPDSAQEKPQEGEVIAVGHGKRLDDGQLVALESNPATAFLSESTPGTRPKWPEPSTLSCREDDVLGVLAAR